ncbi:hypothetical protein [Variovorax sp. CF313]|uniref:hypothetical protein n=1 Tax=Variovorax sp. CF313 TaxID=1144315 RepID=UPI0012FB2D3E|nr:hypothetical protein [Variovorax sp. CF313]
MISTAAAQPLPAASAPAQSASSPVAPATTASSRPVPVQAGYSAIQVELKPADKQGGWTDPTAVVPALAILGSVIATFLQLHYAKRNLNSQLEATRVAAEKQINAQWTNTQAQLEAARAQAANQIAEARKDAQEEREHARLKEIDARLAQERTKVFTELIESYKKAMLVIGALAQANPAKDKKLSDPVADLTASVNKVWLFAGTQTVLETRELLADVMETFLLGMEHCMPIYRNLRGIEEHEEKIKTYLEEKKENSAALSAFQQREAGVLPNTLEHNAQKDLLIGKVTRSGEAVSQGRRLRQEIVNENAMLTKGYVAWLAPRQVGLMNSLNDVLKRARLELHVPGEMESIDLQTVEMLKRLQQAMARVSSLA